jgi:hypothetical protein
MKWINVAEKQPPIEHTVIRDIASKVCLDWMYIRKITPKFITATVNEEFGDDDFPSHEYEWLDEGSVDEKTMKLLYGDKITFKAIGHLSREVRTQVYIDQEGNVYSDADPYGIDMSGKRTIYRDSKIKIIQT